MFLDVESFRRVREKGCTRRVPNSQTYKLRFYNILRRGCKTVAFVILALTASCRRAAPISNEVSDDEYALYAAWINRHFKEQPQRLLLQDQTFIFDPLGQNGCVQNPREKLDRTAVAMLQQYRLLGSAIYAVLTGHFQRPESRVKWRYEESRGFPTEDQARPYSLIAFSRAVFDSSHTRAFFAVSDSCGGLCGYGGLVSAHREHGKWIFDSFPPCAWIS